MKLRRDAAQLRERAAELEAEAATLELVSELALSHRTKTALEEAGYHVVQDIYGLTGAQLKAIPGVGQKGKVEISTALEDYRQSLLT